MGQELKELIIKSVEKALHSCDFSLPKQGEEPIYSFPKYQALTPQFSEPIIPDYQPKIMPEPVLQPDFFVKEEAKPSLNVLATVSQYILVDPSSLNKELQKSDTLLCLVDQCAARSRILFEQLNRDQALPVQPLLIPYTFEATPQEAATILQELDFLNQIGIEIHQSGPKTFSVNALPNFFKADDIQSFIIDLIDQLKTSQKSDLVQQEKEKRLALIAGKLATAQNKTLSIYEAKSLLSSLMQCKVPNQCPKGKQIFAFLTKDELKNFF